MAGHAAGARQCDHGAIVAARASPADGYDRIGIITAECIVEIGTDLRLRARSASKPRNEHNAASRIGSPRLDIDEENVRLPDTQGGHTR